jgi:hypothetical protein
MPESQEPFIYTEDDVRTLMESAITEAGGVRALARKWNVNPQIISRSRKELVPLIARKLGLKENPRTFSLDEEAVKEAQP